jgi:Uma2 family endonuclease
MVTRTQRCTVEELWELSHLPENAGRRFFLLEGVLYEMSPAGWKHGKIALKLGAVILAHVEAYKLGEVTAAETGFRLGEDTVLAPDVGFIRQERVPDELPGGYVPFAPDLAVEVVSPGNDAAEIRAKIEKYLERGTQLVWVVYPDQRKVDAYQRSAGQGAVVHFLDENSTLDGGEVLPGFKLAVQDIFPTEREEQDNHE